MPHASFGHMLDAVARDPKPRVAIVEHTTLYTREGHMKTELLVVVDEIGDSTNPLKSAFWKLYSRYDRGAPTFHSWHSSVKHRVTLDGEHVTVTDFLRKTIGPQRFQQLEETEGFSMNVDEWAHLYTCCGLTVEAALAQASQNLPSGA